MSFILQVQYKFEARIFLYFILYAPKYESKAIYKCFVHCINYKSKTIIFYKIFLFTALPRYSEPAVLLNSTQQEGEDCGCSFIIHYLHAKYLLLNIIHKKKYKIFFPCKTVQRLSYGNTVEL